MGGGAVGVVMVTSIGAVEDREGGRGGRHTILMSIFSSKLSKRSSKRVVLWNSCVRVYLLVEKGLQWSGPRENERDSVRSSCPTQSAGAPKVWRCVCTGVVALERIRLGALPKAGVRAKNGGARPTTTDLRLQIFSTHFNCSSSSPQPHDPTSRQRQPTRGMCIRKLTQ